MISMQLTETQSKRLSSLDNRAKKIIGRDVNIRKLESRKKINVCNFVKQCLDGKSCDRFNDYFQINEHNLRVSSNSLLKLPAVKLEFGKKIF